MKNEKTALVLGAMGIIGRNVVEHLSGQEGWRVKAVSRRPLNYEADAEHRALDLLDPDQLRDARPWLADVDRIYFAAYQEKADPVEACEVNLALLQNTVEAVQEASPDFRHIVFCQGGKVYGAHLGIYRSPAKESQARHFPPNFYFDQEDYLRDASKGKDWSWTALRPDIVMGFAVGNPMNLGNLIATYASISKALGLPLRFPGTPKAYEILVNVTDARLLARAMEWAATNEIAWGECYNITNGDIFRWKHAFPEIARHFGIDCDEPQTISLADHFAGLGPVWERIAAEHGLRPYSLDQLATGPFGDFIFNVEYDAVLDVNKARRHGFHDLTLDSVEEMLALFTRLREQKISL